jgi:MFS family permease
MGLLEFVRHNARWVAGGFTLCFFSSFGQTFFIALSAGEIRAEYDLSHGEFGSVYMGATLCSALVLPHLGRIVDHLHMRRVLWIVIPALATASVLMAVSRHLALLVLAIFCLRLFGQGMMTHTAMTAMGRWFAAQRGKAVSCSMLGAQAGEAALPYVFVSASLWLGWRSTWLMAAAVLVLVALPLGSRLMAVPRQPSASEGIARHRAPRDWTRTEVLRDPVFWVALSGVLAPSFIGTTVFFHQVYLVELRGWSLEVFAQSFTAMALMTVTSVIVTGAAVDRFSAVAMLPGMLVPLSLASFALALLEAQWGAFVIMALVGVSYGITSTLFGALWPEIYGTRHLGSVRAAIVAMMVFSTAMGPGITGLLIDMGIDLPTQMHVMGVYCLLACGALWSASRRIRERNLGAPGQIPAREHPG